MYFLPKILELKKKLSLKIVHTCDGLDFLKEKVEYFQTSKQTPL